MRKVTFPTDRTARVMLRNAVLCLVLIVCGLRTWRTDPLEVSEGRLRLETHLRDGADCSVWRSPQGGDYRLSLRVGHENLAELHVPLGDGRRGLQLRALDGPGGRDDHLLLVSLGQPSVVLWAYCRSTQRRYEPLPGWATPAAGHRVGRLRPLPPWMYL